MQRVEELQREFNDTRAEMAAMSLELRAIATSGMCANTSTMCPYLKIRSYIQNVVRASVVA